MSEQEDFDPEELLLDTLARKELERIEYGERLADVYLQDAADMLASARLEPSWLVKNAIPAAAVSFFVGKPGAAKSWLAYDLACALTQQREWLGFGVPNGGASPSAMILNFDNPHEECARRFLRLGLTPEARLWTHSFGAHTPPEPFPAVLQLPDAFEPLEAMIYARRPNLVVVDSLRQAHTSDESSSQEMARVMSQVKRFATLGCAVVIVHHSRKNDGAMRGSTEIEATADSITDIEKDEAEVSLVSWRKTRGWQMIEPTVSVRLVDEGDRTFVRGGVSLQTLLANGPMTRSEIQTALELRQDATKKLVDKAIETGLAKEIRTNNGGRAIELAERRT